jgi:hypothetical protein
VLFEELVQLLGILVVGVPERAALICQLPQNAGQILAEVGLGGRAARDVAANRLGRVWPPALADWFRPSELPRD